MDTENYSLSCDKVSAKINIFPKRPSLPTVPLAHISPECRRPSTESARLRGINRGEDRDIRDMSGGGVGGVESGQGLRREHGGRTGQRKEN